MSYIMDRYANMRGTYFVKFVRGSGSAGTVDSQVASQSSQAKVLNAAATSKAVASAKNPREICGIVSLKVYSKILWYLTKQRQHSRLLAVACLRQSLRLITQLATT